MATPIGPLDFALAVGFFGGFGLFFKGFRAYREYLLLQGTPGIPIRSISMGRARVHGKAISQHPVSSPISHTPCCFYQVKIEKWHAQEDSGRWLYYGAEADGSSFYLEDSSGRVLVDPDGAECEIELTVVREASSAGPSITPADGVSDLELLQYAARVGPSPEAPGLQHSLEAGRMMVEISKGSKQATTPNELMRGLFPQVLEGEAKILGALEAEEPQSDPLREQLRLAQIELHKHPIWSPEYAAGFKRVTKLQAEVQKKAGPRIETPVPAAPPPPAPEPATPEEIVASTSGLPSATGRYRFTERCILPNHEYDITGTCVENPGAQDAGDRNLIRKGTHESTFLISGLAQPNVNSMVQIRAQFMIVGGGMLAIFCLGILLLRFGQF